MAVASDNPKLWTEQVGDDNSKHLHSAYYLSDTVLSTLHKLFNPHTRSHYFLIFYMWD